LKGILHLVSPLLLPAYARAMQSEERQPSSAERHLLLQPRLQLRLRKKKKKKKKKGERVTWSQAGVSER